MTWDRAVPLQQLRRADQTDCPVAALSSVSATGLWCWKQDWWKPLWVCWGLSSDPALPALLPGVHRSSVASHRHSRHPGSRWASLKKKNDNKFYPVQKNKIKWLCLKSKLTDLDLASIIFMSIESLEDMLQSKTEDTRFTFNFKCLENLFSFFLF